MRVDTDGGHGVEFGGDEGQLGEGFRRDGRLGFSSLREFLPECDTKHYANHFGESQVR